MRIKPENSIFVQVDIQEKLFPHISNNEELEKNLQILIKGLKLHEVPVIVNEQYKKGIGETIPSIQELTKDYPHFEKTTFSCCGNEDGLNAIKASGRDIVILAGIETHVCVLQTAIDLLEEGFKVVLVTDCVNSRKEKDKEMAITRLVQAGAIPTTYESLLFELTVNAKHPVFKEISKLVK